MNDGLLEQYKLLHRHPETFRGYSLGPHVEKIKALIDETGSKTLLDYGCGKGWQYSKKHYDEVFGIKPTLYDPAVPEFSKPPQGRFDGVYCTDVLEHVLNPIDFAHHVISFADKFVFFSISCIASPTKKLPDGRPRHISVYPPQWWRSQIKCPVRLELAFDVPE